MMHRGWCTGDDAPGMKHWGWCFGGDAPGMMLVPKCIYPKCIFAKCTRLACLLSFASLLPPYLGSENLKIPIIGSKIKVSESWLQVASFEKIGHLIPPLSRTTLTEDKKIIWPMVDIPLNYYPPLGNLPGWVDPSWANACLQAVSKPGQLSGCPCSTILQLSIVNLSISRPCFAILPFPFSIFQFCEFCISRILLFFHISVHPYQSIRVCAG